MQIQTELFKKHQFEKQMLFKLVAKLSQLILISALASRGSSVSPNDKAINIKKLQSNGN